MPVLALGVSYRRASVELLERLALGEGDYAKAYHHLAALDSVRESVIVSTCNRVEVFAEVGRYHQGFQDLKRFLAEGRDVPVEDLAEALYSHYEDHAVEHLFAVASGIDSMVVGEPQILSQVRAAIARAQSEGAAGTALSSLFRHALRTGKRARAETAIGAAPAAFVEAGAALAEAHLGALEARSLLVVGAGKMGALAAGWLRTRGIGSVRVLNRTPERAARVAARVGGAPGALGDLVDGLARADLVVCSTGATAPVVTREAVETALRGGGRPLFLLDLGMPRDVEPAVREIPGVRVADIDDLRDRLADHPSAGEVARVRRVVEEEARKFAARRREAALAPLIRALRDRGERVRVDELRRVASLLARLPQRDREIVEGLTRRIVNRLLHDPVVRLKELAGAGPGDPFARTLTELFDLRPED